MQNYLKCLPKPLSDNETNKYFKLMDEGCKTAKKILIEHNLRLVFHIVKKYINVGNKHNFYFDTEDLMSVGSIGLIKAVDSFDLNKGTKFATYSSRCIELEILNYIRKFKKLDISIDNQISINNGENSFTIADTIPSNKNIEEDIIFKNNLKDVKNSLTLLTEEEKKVIALRYNNRKKIPQQKIADMLGYSQSYVSRIEKNALKKLKKDCHEKPDKEVKPIINETTKIKIIEIANCFIKEDISLKQLAVKYNVSRSSIHVYLMKKLKDIDINLYDEVILTINKRKEEKKINLIKERKYIKTLDDIKNKPLVIQKSDDYNQRKKRNRIPVSISEVFPHQPEDRILNVISELNEVNRVIFEMKYGLNGYQHTDVEHIASVMKMSTQNIYTRLYHTRALIKKVLNATGEEHNKKNSHLSYSKKKHK